jgi:hypothetical protein
LDRIRGSERSALPTDSTFNALQTALNEENRMAFPPDTRSMTIRNRLNTMAAALVLVFGSSLPLNAQPKAPEDLGQYRSA